MQFPFDNSYVHLPESLFSRVRPTPVAAPRLIAFNRPLARSLGLADAGDERELAEIFSGNRLPPGAEPLAMAYSGHQFGQFVPLLGDGRAILVGEVRDEAGQRYDIQLKGAGLTPYSRRGDGRAALGPVMREYLVSEAMAALGIPTTRALAAVVTGERVVRERFLPGAVMTRVARSHIRVGTFQYVATSGDVDSLKRLADYAIDRLYPELAGAEAPYQRFLEAVIARQARLVARWMHVGFVHGVMNTDNTSISGETIDFGPCAFLDAYHPGMVFSSIDEMGRYAFGNQPRIMLWNLTRLAEALLPLLAETQEAAIAMAEAILGSFKPVFETAFEAGVRSKLGLSSAEPGDVALATELYQLMAADKVDFTLAFRRLADAAESEWAGATVRDLFVDLAGFDAWGQRWRERLSREPGGAEAASKLMRSVNPAVIPRNHLIEAVIKAAIEAGDFEPFHALAAALAEPYADRPEFAWAQESPKPDEVVTATFCGT
ncbi:MAG: YdiU family protein [Ancalomicrobiaceae bacterium]|nr:YdiU family protein [Ancalomicrobiaceae bacterium]